jgi:hypothetical protein
LGEEMKSILDEFVPMRKIIPPGIAGRARIVHFNVSEEDAKFSQMRAAMKADRDLEVSAGKYVRLVIKNSHSGIGYTAMSDTQMEKRTNIEFLIQARGHILVAGLGLGLILIPALKKDIVESIEVIEKYPDVIQLVEPHLRIYLDRKCNKKLTVTQGDIFEWKPPKGKKWDTIYFDIWQDVCEDNLEGITRLKRKFARRLNRKNPDCWMGAWKEDDLRYWRRRRGYQ